MVERSRRDSLEEERELRSPSDLSQETHYKSFATP